MLIKGLCCLILQMDCSVIYCIPEDVLEEMGLSGPRTVIRIYVMRIRIVWMLYQFLLTFTPLVLGAVQSSECTVDISILPSVWGIFFIVIYFWHTLLVSLFILNVISLSYKIPFFQLFMFLYNPTMPLHVFTVLFVRRC